MVLGSEQTLKQLFTGLLERWYDERKVQGKMREAIQTKEKKQIASGIKDNSRKLT